MAEEKKDWGWILGLFLLGVLGAPKVIPPPPEKVVPSPSPTIITPPAMQRPSPTPTPSPQPAGFSDNPTNPKANPNDAFLLRHHQPVDYSPTISLLEKHGFTVIAVEETIQYGKGALTPTQYIDIWIAEAKEQGFRVPAEKELRDLYAGRISYEEYKKAYIEEVKPPSWYIELWNKYERGELTYEQYLEEYKRRVS